MTYSRQPRSLSARGARLALALCASASAAPAPVRADSRPALDDFYDRTRDRDDGFESCTGYCDGRWLAGFLVGAQTANPAAPPMAGSAAGALAPKLATGGRLGIDLAVRGGYADVARTKLWLDLLRVHESGDWIADLAWQTTAFAALGHPGAPGLHLSLDSVVAQRTELEPSDLARLQRRPYRELDLEAEVAPTGGKIDKDAFLAVPLGAAVRLLSPEDGRLEHRTSVSGALALRGFPKQIRHHYQLDVLRAKRTSWDVPGGTATAWTLSAGYQRLSPDIPGLQLWLLAGYEWAGDRRGPVVQIGADLELPAAGGTLSFSPRFDEHLELDPRTAQFSRVYEGRFSVRHRTAPPTARFGLWWGLAYEAVLIEDAGKLHALTPELGFAYRGLELGLRYRFTSLRDVDEAEPMSRSLSDRFQLSLDRLF